MAFDLVVYYTLAVLAVVIWAGTWLVVGYRIQLIAMRRWPEAEDRLPRDWGPWAGLLVAAATAAFRWAH